MTWTFNPWRALRPMLRDARKADGRQGMSEDMRGPWHAYARTGPGHRSQKMSVDHATTDGKTTLCGLKEIGGHDPNSPFQVGAAMSCQRCSAAVARMTDEYICTQQEAATRLGLKPPPWGLNPALPVRGSDQDQRGRGR